jgi:hypothetical protein
MYQMSLTLHGIAQLGGVKLSRGLHQRKHNSLQIATKLRLQVLDKILHMRQHVSSNGSFNKWFHITHLAVHGLELGLDGLALGVAAGGQDLDDSLLVCMQSQAMRIIHTGTRRHPHQFQDPS